MDDFESHPRYADQVNLELEMRDGGATLHTERVTKAKERHQLSTLAPHRATIRRWIPAVADAIKQHIAASRQFERSTGMVPTSLKYLKAVDPSMAAYITLRTVMNRMGSGRAGIVGCAKEIGSTIQHEAKLRMWEKQEPDLYYWTERNLDDDKATPLHRRKVHINRFNALREKGTLTWTEWPSGEVTRLGIDLMNVTIHATGAFHVEDDPLHQHVPGVVKSPQKVLVLDDNVFDHLDDQVAALEFLSPVYMPTFMPPKRWDGEGRGGYWTDYVEAPRLIRFKASQRDQRKGAEAEYEALDLSVPLKALHVLQETPWTIHPTVIRAVEHIWDNDLGEAGLPIKNVRDKYRLPVQPEDFEESEEARIAWRRLAAPVYANRIAVLKAYTVVERTVAMARRFKGETFYFPHMLDFRGRMYPIPADLQPQGTDLARGLLTFATGKPIDGTGRAWLLVHLANVCGHDKVNFNERIDWSLARMEAWEKIERDPIGNRHLWQTAGDGKKPFQVLAAAVEVIRAFEHGDGYVSCLPVSVDGTCNGIQHLAAMVRDEASGAAVNLVPSDRPKDIYQDVADEVGHTLERIESAGGEQGDKAAWWLGLCEFRLPRSLTKRPVMILPYGGTREAYFKYTREWLKDNHPRLLERTNIDQRIVGSNIRFLTGIMWDAVQAKLPQPLAVMRWLQECAEKAAMGNQPVFWTVPSGFVVRHFYGKMKLHQIRLRLDGQSMVLGEWKPTDQLDKREQLKGISPNFVHSIDASALAECIVDASTQHGIECFMAIHDSYGTLAADMWKLHHTLREAFVFTHDHGVLNLFRFGCQEVIARHIEHTERCPFDEAMDRADHILPPPLPVGSLDVGLVRQSEYFFA